MRVPVATTTATFGGSKSRGMAHAAAMTFGPEPSGSHVVTRVVGPWLRSL